MNSNETLRPMKPTGFQDTVMRHMCYPSFVSEFKGWMILYEDGAVIQPAISESSRRDEDDFLIDACTSSVHLKWAMSQRSVFLVKNDVAHVFRCNSLASTAGGYPSGLYFGSIFIRNTEEGIEIYNAIGNSICLIGEVPEVRIFSYRKDGEIFHLYGASYRQVNESNGKVVWGAPVQITFNGKTVSSVKHESRLPIALKRHCKHAAQDDMSYFEYHMWRLESYAGSFVTDNGLYLIGNCIDARESDFSALPNATPHQNNYEAVCILRQGLLFKQITSLHMGYAYAGVLKDKEGNDVVYLNKNIACTEHGPSETDGIYYLSSKESFCRVNFSRVHGLPHVRVYSARFYYYENALVYYACIDGWQKNDEKEGYIEVTYLVLSEDGINWKCQTRISKEREKGSE